MNVDIRNDSRRVLVGQRRSGECNPIGMMDRSYERVLFAVQRAGNLAYFRQRAGNLAYFRLRRFLD